MAKKLSDKQAREGVKNITKHCPSCGGGFVFMLRKHYPKGNAVIADFVQMLGRGEVQISSVEDVEDELREGKSQIHPLAQPSQDDGEGRTSAGVKWSEVPEHSRHHAEWIDGRHGPAASKLPGLEAVPVPAALVALSSLHPDRPRGSKAMLDASGAKARLAEARAGAWLISTFTGWKWAKWPCGEVGWLPEEVEVPEALRVGGRNYDA